MALDETRQANAETRRANRYTHVRELYVEAAAAKLLNDPDNLGVSVGGSEVRILFVFDPDRQMVLLGRETSPGTGNTGTRSRYRSRRHGTPSISRRWRMGEDKDDEDNCVGMARLRRRRSTDR